MDLSLEPHTQDRCSISLSQLLDFCEGKLSPDDSLPVEAHLRGACPVCLRRLRDIRSLLRGLSLLSGEGFFDPPAPN